MEYWINSYDQFVGQGFIPLKQCRIAAMMALSDGSGNLLGLFGGIADVTGSSGCGCRALRMLSVSALAGAGKEDSYVFVALESCPSCASLCALLMDRSSWTSCSLC